MSAHAHARPRIVPTPLAVVRVENARYSIGPLVCLYCGRACRDYVEGYGILRPMCSRWCRRWWDAVRLPPGARGAEVTALYGEAVARAFWRVLRPHDDPCDQTALALFPLPVPLDSPCYLQRAPDEAEPAVAWRKAAAMIHVVMAWP